MSMTNVSGASQDFGASFCYNAFMRGNDANGTIDVETVCGIPCKLSGMKQHLPVGTNTRPE